MQTRLEELESIGRAAFDAVVALVMCRSAFCVHGSGLWRGYWWSTFGGPHNDHSEQSHFIKPSSFCHPRLGRDASELSTGGEQAAIAAFFVRRVISA